VYKVVLLLRTSNSEVGMNRHKYMTRNLVIIIRLVVFPCLVLATNAVGGRGYEAPPILNFDTRWRKVVSSTLCPYYRRGNYHGTHR